LLDTNVISELRRPKPHGAVSAWVSGLRDDEIHVAAVTVGEIQAGIELTRDRDPEKADEIEAWLDQMARTKNVLPMDGRAFREWARLMHHRANHLSEDAMIAAIAIVHDLTVATRNVKDFKPFGVRTFNPFTGKTASR
jgi:toxin FitB